MTADVEALRRRFPRVAIAHEWLTIPGGSEKVVMAILDLLPHAELFTSVYDPAPWPRQITSRPVHTSFLQRVPGANRHYPKLLPLMDRAFRSFDLSGFDLVISSNHACAKNVRVPAGVPHVCYCHTPIRYAWEPEFLAAEDLSAAQRAALPALTAWLRRVDRRRAAGPTVFVANSSHVAERIRRHYGRDAVVVHPPVDVERFLALARDPDDAYLVFGRLVPYKRAGDAIAACARLGRRLRVAGDGRARAALEAEAGPGAEFLGFVAEEQVGPLLARSRALLFPGEEDFGIVPVEAQAAGLPVIAYGSGGVRDSVLDGETGVLYEPAGPEVLARAIERFEGLRFDDARLRTQARRFAPEAFHERFAAVLAALPARTRAA